MDSQGNGYQIKSRTTSIILILSLLICFVSTELGQIQAISDFNYTLHEMLYIPINMAIILIPVEVIFVVYYFFRWIAGLRKGNNGKLKTVMLVNLTAFICLFLFICYFVYMSYGVSTSGLYEKVGKENHKNKYYIVIGNARLSCTRNEYNLISTDRKYLISYKWNKLSPQKGKIDYIKEDK